MTNSTLTNLVAADRDSCADDEDIVIRANGLTKYYGTHIGVADIDLEVRRGEVFGFIGPNGAGKTTTIRLLLDLIRPTSGSAKLFGLDSHRSSVELKQRLGYVPGRFHQFERLTAAELFSWLGKIQGSYDKTNTEQLAERLKLDTTRRIGELSTGNQQKVAIVQAMMHRPELLIFDEPTSGLDPVVRRVFRDLVYEQVARGATVFLSSHVLAEVEDICDRVGMVIAGRLTRIDTVADLKAESRRRVHLKLKADVPPKELDTLASVRSYRVVGRPGGLADDDRRSGHRYGSGTSPDVIEIAVESVGPIDALIKAISHYEVVDFLSEPLTLEDVFFAAYANGDDRPSVGPSEDATATDQATTKEASHEYQV